MWRKRTRPRASGELWMPGSSCRFTQIQVVGFRRTRPRVLRFPFTCYYRHRIQLWFYANSCYYRRRIQLLFYANSRSRVPQGPATGPAVSLHVLLLASRVTIEVKSSELISPNLFEWHLPAGDVIDHTSVRQNL